MTLLRSSRGRALATAACAGLAATLAAWLVPASSPRGALVVGAAAAAGAALMGLWHARAMNRSLQLLKNLADERENSLAGRLPALEPAEVAEAARAFARQAERLRDLSESHANVSAVLASMAEGVIAFDRREKILLVNPAAGRLFDVTPASVLGRPLPEVVRSAEIQRLVAAAASREETVEAELVLAGQFPRQLHVSCTILRDSSQRAVGALLVLDDLTHVRRLEQVRRDFVANVSHEIRTPITTIKGFVETLLDGALEDPAEAERMLRTVARHVDRLNAIVEDLLALSRLEPEGEPLAIRLDEGRLRDVLQAALEACRPAAAAKSVALDLDCDAELVVRMNAPLLEQAVVNLVDNAVKYSDSAGAVHVAAARRNGEVTVTVSDQGSGIEAEHLPRLFERFYRVDKARSRKVGGTGLGLAIVKHVAQAHGGSVSVESTPGRGSVFSITLPA